MPTNTKVNSKLFTSSTTNPFDQSIVINLLFTVLYTDQIKILSLNEQLTFHIMFIPDETYEILSLITSIGMLFGALIEI